MTDRGRDINVFVCLGLFKGGASQEPTVCTKRYAQALSHRDSAGTAPRNLKAPKLRETDGWLRTSSCRSSEALRCCTLEEVPSSERCVPGATGAPGPRERRPPTQDERQERTLRMQSVRSTAPTAARAKRFIAHRSAQQSGSSRVRALKRKRSSSPSASSSPSSHHQQT